MNCKEFKIWINTSAEQDLLNPPSTVLKHINKCASCQTNYKRQKDAAIWMSTQKDFSLSQEKLNNIILSLNNKKHTSKLYLHKQKLIILSRYAAILVICTGLLAGIFAGSLISKKTKQESNSWSSEFTLMSDNTYYDSELFE